MDKKGAVKPLPVWGRGLVFLISLVFFIALLEGVLILAGRLVFDRPTIGAPDADNPGTRRILCLGDSYTHGGLVDDDETYPAYLQKTLDKTYGPGAFRVFNQGVCETNTTELIAYLPGVLEKYRPDLVILLVGSANLFNPWEFDKHRKDDWKSRLKSWFYDRRVVQMLRLMSMSFMETPALEENLEEEYNLGKTYTRLNYLKANHSNCEFDPPDYRKMYASSPEPGDMSAHEFWEHVKENRYEDALKTGKAFLDDPDAKDSEHRVLFKMIGLAMDREDLVEAAKWINSTLPGGQRLTTEQLRSCASEYFRYFGDELMQSGQYDRAAEVYLKGVKAKPISEDNFYWLSKVFDRQSHIDAQTVVDTLKKLQREALDSIDPNPSPFLEPYIRIFEDKLTWERQVKNWIEDDLDTIIRMIRRTSRVPLVLQTYPIEYPLANSALKDAAKEHKLPLVDHTPVFDALSPKNKYFLDDDHCTPLGHQVMVKTLYETLVKERVIAR